MTKVIEEYKRFTSDDKLMRAYDARDAFLVGQKIMLDREREEGIKEGIEKGIKRGIKKGIKEGKLEGMKEGIIEGMERGIREQNYIIAKSMKKENIDIETIKRITGLTVDEIKKL